MSMGDLSEFGLSRNPLALVGPIPEGLERLRTPALNAAQCEALNRFRQ